VDVQTKMAILQSSPKAYNLDKILEPLPIGSTTFAFYFVGIDRRTDAIATSLVYIFDAYLLAATRIKFHWAGRNSLGVTQLTGDFSHVFAPDFTERIDVNTAVEFLQRLVEL